MCTHLPQLPTPATQAAAHLAVGVLRHHRKLPAAGRQLAGLRAHAQDGGLVRGAREGQHGQPGVFGIGLRRGRRSVGMWGAGGSAYWSGCIERQRAALAGAGAHLDAPAVGLGGGVSRRVDERQRGVGGGVGGGLNVEDQGRRHVAHGGRDQRGGGRRVDAVGVLGPHAQVDDPGHVLALEIRQGDVELALAAWSIEKGAGQPRGGRVRQGRRRRAQQTGRWEQATHQLRSAGVRCACCAASRCLVRPPAGVP